LVALSAAAALLLTGCATGAPETDDSGSSDAGPTIGLITNQGNYFFQSIQSTLEDLAEADGGQILAVNTNNDAAAEAQAIQDFIQRQVDVILVSVQSADGSLASVKAASDAGIPVICYNSCLGDDDAAKYTKAYVKSDDYDLGHATGEFAAEYIENELGGSAQLGLLNCDAFAVCVERKNGFKDALEDLDITYVSDQEGYLADKATGVAQDVITANPDMDGFWAVNEGGTVGAWSAISATGGGKVVFGTDISPEIAGHMTSGDGIIVATTGQDGAALAKTAYDAAKTVIGGGEVDPFVQQAPGHLYSIDDLDEITTYLESAGD
jgi:simple sugar transport system substrate-binding protein